MRLSESETSLEPENIPDRDKSEGFAPVLKNNRFLILWSGQIFSQLADKVYLVNDDCNCRQSISVAKSAN